MKPAGPLAYFAAFLLPATVLLGYYGGAWVPGGTYFTLIFAYALVPAVDAVVTLFETSFRHGSTCELSSDQATELDKIWTYRIAVILWVPVQFALLLWMLSRPLAQLSTSNLVGLGVSMGFTGVGGANVAHELFHKLPWYERLLGKSLLVSICYGHFALEHSAGHHKRVGTFEDPATARLDESFYHFWPRSVFGGLASAWKIGGGAVLSNPVLHYAVAQVFFAMGVRTIFGYNGFLVWLLHAFVAVTILEKANYIEHYGLQRRKLSDNRYERVGPEHSWDAPQRVTNFLLFKLQRHADHHIHSMKKYQALRGLPGSPRLPFGYATLAVLTLIPPLWRCLMNPRVVEFKFSLDQASLETLDR